MTSAATFTAAEVAWPPDCPGLAEHVHIDPLGGWTVWSRPEGCELRHPVQPSVFLTLGADVARQRLEDALDG